ncbi:MAG: hypothetical protein ACTSUE_11160 [Promethearchaeota archaeon]
MSPTNRSHLLRLLQGEEGGGGWRRMEGGGEGWGRVEEGGGGRRRAEEGRGDGCKLYRHGPILCKE